MADARDALLEQASAAFDGEAPSPLLDADAQRWLDGAARLRASLRVGEAEAPPDLTAAILARVEREVAPVPITRRRRPTVLAAAAVFLVAAVVAALAVRPGGPVGPVPAAADVGDEVLAAQVDVAAMDAEVRLVERAAHPEVPLRSYRGTLRYRAPEQLWLHLEQTGAPPDGWPRNDLDLVVDDGVAWSRGLHPCPVASQPACFDGPDTRVATGLPPFAADWVAPLDLVIPADAFLPDAHTSSTTEDGTVTIDTSVARMHELVDGLTAAGALRAVHATDRVHVELDAEQYTLRRLVVRAGASDARSLWAATNGYPDEPGSVLLDLELTPATLPDASFPPVPATEGIDAGFDDRAAPPGPAPAWLPEGFTAHRSGAQPGTAPHVGARSWSNGRAWVRLETAEGWDERVLFGDLGPLVRQLPVGDGAGYADPAGSRLALHTEDLDLVLTGSVPLETLVEIAASLPLEGRALPEGWPQAEVLTDLPDGALRPRGPLLARYDGADLVVSVPGPGATSAVLSQRPGSELGLPVKADVVETPVRGTVGRYLPTLGILTWVEGGWVRELQSDGLDVDSLVATAEALVAG